MPFTSAHTWGILNLSLGSKARMKNYNWGKEQTVLCSTDLSHLAAMWFSWDILVLTMNVAHWKKYHLILSISRGQASLNSTIWYSGCFNSCCSTKGFSITHSCQSYRLSLLYFLSGVSSWKTGICANLIPSLLYLFYVFTSNASSWLEGDHAALGASYKIFKIGYHTLKCV